MYPVVCFGEVLWDVLPSGAVPGGAPMNVAYHLKKLGTNPAMITRIGRDGYGQELLRIFSKEGLTTDYFYVDSEQPTGVVYANPGGPGEVVYDIVFPSAWDFIEWKEAFVPLLQQSAYFVFGSLACRHKTSRETLFRLLETPATTVFDINLRPPHYQRQQVEYLLQKAGMVKMNLAELEVITGWFTRFYLLEDSIKLLQDRFKMDTLIVTMGGEGAIVSEKGTFFRHAGFKVTVADTIGSGDAFLAGFLHQRLSGAPVEQALAFACGIGAFMATQRGACPPYEPAQITELIRSMAMDLT